MTQINTWPGWEYVRLIGDGSFGRVYEIRRQEYGKTFSAALKVITIPQNPSEIDTARSEGMDHESITEYYHSIVEEIAREFSIMSDIKGHSNIVSYEDHAVIPHENGIGWDILLRMELLTPLLEYEEQHTFSEKMIIKLGCDICRALEICDNKNIIHRDIKPENIFVNDNQDFKLGDFGIARTTERDVSNFSKKGTYSYMAPEVYLGKPYGKTVDIYSLGMVLYRYLNCNRTAFLPTEGAIRFGDREDALERRMRGEKIPEPVNGSAAIKRIVLKALSYNPEDRYQNAAEFLKDLQQCAFLGGENTVSIWGDEYLGPRKDDYSLTRKIIIEDRTKKKPKKPPISNHPITERPPVREYHPNYSDYEQSKPWKIIIALGAAIILLTIVIFAFLFRKPKAYPDCILPDSSREYLTQSKMDRMSLDVLYLARNEIYARHGRIFDDPVLKEYFDSCEWYHGKVKPDDFDKSVLNKYEKTNADILLKEEEARKEKEVIFPSSSEIVLDESDLNYMTIDSLYLARNEIYARHNRTFKDPLLKEYFGGISWYNGTIPYKKFKDEEVLSPLELNNMDLMLTRERALREAEKKE